MAISLEKGANIVIDRWCQVKQGESVLLVADEHHMTEAMALWEQCSLKGASVALVALPEDSIQAGDLFDSMHDFVVQHDVIIGASGFSLITNHIVKEVLKKGSRFLSLPLSSNNHQSVLTFDFMDMDPEISNEISKGMRQKLEKAEKIHVITPAGTDITFGKRNRHPGLFNGMTELPGKVGSSSFEVYIGIVETETNGHAVIDGSLGYIGVPETPIHITFKDGKMTEIEDNTSGHRLKSYMEGFDDPEIFVAGELGIGLNQKGKCCGNCYIEDESCYGTFHIGMGRNIALGGIHDAQGHFDLVFCKPTIYADDMIIMQDGNVVL